MGNETHVDSCNCNSCQIQHKNAELWDTVNELREKVKRLEESTENAIREVDRFRFLYGNLQVENVSLVMALRSYTSKGNIASVALSSSSSAKWLEAVEKVVETVRHHSKGMNCRCDGCDALTELDALEKEGE